MVSNYLNGVRGDAGEGLFQYLVGEHWGARVISHGNAPRTDAMLEWPRVFEAGRISVQVKSVARLIGSTFYLRPREIEGWYLIKPLLVLCERSLARGWWIDPEPFGPPVGCESFSLPLSEARPISPGTRSEVIKIAYDRNHEFMLQLNASGAWHRFPQDERSLLELIKTTLTDLEAAHLFDRDVKALALARLIHTAGSLLPVSQIMPLLENLLHIVVTSHLGGRSHAFGAVVSLLLRYDPGRQSAELAKMLLRAAHFAVLSGDFGHAEFGLLAAARAAELQRRRSVVDVHELAQGAPAGSQTPWFRRTALALRSWDPVEKPISKLFGSRTLADTILRPSDPSVRVLSWKHEAERVVARIIRDGPVGILDHEFRMVDQLTRIQADHYLWYQLGVPPRSAQVL